MYEELINEFTLSTSSKQSNQSSGDNDHSILSEEDLVVIDFGGIKTVLSGSTDYALLIKSVARQNLRGDIIQFKGKFLP